MCILCEAMNAMRYIRLKVFKLRQQDFATMAGVQQSTVSRWENGGAPTLDEMRAIRAAASERKIKWRDEWFFRDPEEQAA